jgi:glutamate-1-semialdehyde 2,1-aminomutase
MLTTDKSKSLYERACKSLALGVSSGLRRSVTPVPLYFERADGPYFHDADGNQLLDYTLAWGPLILGSNHAGINAAVTRQLGRGYTYGAQHHDEIHLAELMCRSVPGVEQVIFSNTGTEAVQAALRLARAHTGRHKFIKFEGHYHGWLNNVLVSYRPSPENLGKPAPTCGGQPQPEFSQTLVLPWNDLDAIRRAFEEDPGDIAAVIFEPVLANSGSCMPQPGYLQGVVELCRQYGAVSIFDEVITGFRLALGGAREYFGVIPDLSVYAKAMAGGFSMAAVGGRRDIFEALWKGKTIHAGTYNGNCIAITASIATIEALSEKGLYSRMHEHGLAIRKVIEQSAARHGHTLVTTGTGTVFSVHFDLQQAPLRYTDITAANAAKYNTFRALMLAHGVQLLPEGRWYVGAAHGSAELEIVTKAIQNAMAEL